MEFDATYTTSTHLRSLGPALACCELAKVGAYFNTCEPSLLVDPPHLVVAVPGLSTPRSLHRSYGEFFEGNPTVN